MFIENNYNKTNVDTKNENNFVVCMNAVDDEDNVCMTSLSDKILYLETEGAKLRAQVSEILNEYCVVDNARNSQINPKPLESTILKSDNNFLVMDGTNNLEEKRMESSYTTQNNAIHKDKIYMSKHKYDSVEENLENKSELHDLSLKLDNEFLKREIDAATSHVTQLQDKLSKVNVLRLEEQNNFLSQIGELKNELQNKSFARNKDISEYKSILLHRDAKILKLEKHLKELLETNEQQQNVLCQVNKRDELRKEKYNVLTEAFDLGKQILSEFEKRAALRFKLSIPPSNQTPLTIIYCFQTFLQSLESEVETRENTISELQQHLEKMKEETSAEKAKIIALHKLSFSIY